MPIVNFEINEQSLPDGSIRKAMSRPNVSFSTTDGARADSPDVTEFLIERDFSIAASADFFDAVMETGKAANELTCDYNADVQGETAESWSIGEGTAIGWSMSQEKGKEVKETLTILAREATVDRNGTQVEYVYDPSDDGA